MAEVNNDKDIYILLEARKLMFQLGVKSLTMDDIAKHLGISKKTLYQVVENKADLVDKVITYTLQEQKTEISKIINAENNAIEELLAIYKHNSCMSGKIHTGILFELRKYFPKSWAKMDNFRMETIFQHIAENMSRGIEQGLYREDIHIPIIARLYTARSIDVFNTDLFPSKTMSPNVVLREMFIYHLRGIASMKGIEFLENHIQVDFKN